MVFKKYIGVIIILLMTGTACKKSSPKPINGPVDVYVTGSSLVNFPGYAGGLSFDEATYWKNGISSVLSSTTTSESNAFGIAVQGNDVYVVGYYFTGVFSTNGNNIAVACYWKNGALTNLTDGSHSAIAFAIASSGNDIYIVGYINGPNSTAVYWKNGVMTKLTDSGNSSAAYSINIQGSDVYIAGNIVNSAGKGEAAYWKNGSLTVLPDHGIYSVANSIAVNGANVYLAGIDFESVATLPPPGQVQVATSWKNGLETMLADNSQPSDARGIVLNGNDVYIAGTTNVHIAIGDSNASIATYWKNGTANILTTNSTYSIATAWGIALNGTDIYVSGNDMNENATYWKNGIAVNLGTQGPYVSSILLVAK